MPFSHRPAGRLRAPALLSLFFVLAAAPALFGQPLDLDRLGEMEARAIGPAGMSGRVTAVDVVLRDPDVIYVGTASGGLWRSTSGGIGWEPIFDDQPVASIGAIDVFQKNPSIIYVGTGEGNPRNSQTSGNGVYKSMDGGRTWTHLGLEQTRNIHRIFVHPDDHDVVYVAAQGPAWGETTERGVFKTTDGGRTWEKILYANERTGPGEMVMDPTNPEKLIVAMWEFRRWPWFFESGGPGSGLFVSHDGGATWTERTHEDGLPEGELGRIGLAIAPSNPNVVYALVEAEKNALYRSDDGGFTFRKTADENIGGRPFYYAEIHADTRNENRLYNLHSTVTVSDDGGRTFEQLMTAYGTGGVHPDHHAWWQHPDDPDFIIDGNDGGAYISRDRGASWRFVENLPLAQFYHINVDMETPYNVMGGLQDNGSWRGPSQVWREGGIRNAYWREVAFGDGFDVVPDASDSRYVYAMSQGGNLRRSDLESGQQKYIKPTHPDGTFLRFNWNAGIAQDPFNPTTIYYGSQFLHKSTDRGDTWMVISPDLTTDDPEKQNQLESGGLSYDVTQAENFTTIVAIAPSPVREGVIWVGTDDGNVQLTTDGGDTWTNVVGNIPGVPAGTWVPQIHASVHDPAEAFVVFDDHRRNNWSPYLYHTDNFGQTWTRLTDEDDVFGYTLSVVQDPVERDLLFLGTEFGLYVSIDAGANWTKWTKGFPTVSTMDLVIHPREHDLVIATFGRSVYILDDIRPLRALARDGLALLDAPVHAFEAPDAVIAATAQADGTRFEANAMFAGENRPTGALITYAINPDAVEDEEGEEDEEEMDTPKGEEGDDLEAEEAAGRPGARSGRGGGDSGHEVTIEILDEDGEVIRTLKDEAEPGVNRTVWQLRRKGVRMAGGGGGGRGGRGRDREPAGPTVMPGTYTARLSYGGGTSETQIEVRMDPRIEVSEAALVARGEMQDRWMAHMRAVSEARERLTEAGETIAAVDRQLGDRDDDEAKAAQREGREAKEALDALVEEFDGKEVQGIRRDPLLVTSLLSTASGYLNSSWDFPSENERHAMRYAEQAVQGILAEVNAFFENEWPAYQDAVEAADVSPFEDYAPLEVGVSASSPQR